MKRQLIPMSELKGKFPFAPSTLYTGKSLGRYPWLTRHGPDGERGRYLWVDTAKFDEWAAAKGTSFRFHPQVKEGGQH